MNNRAAPPSSPDTHLYIGLMSGTSTDGVDAVAADFSQPQQPRILGLASLDLPDDLRQELLALNTPGSNELARAHLAANALARCYAEAVRQVLRNSALEAAAIQGIGAHGQTVRHDPAAGYTIQLNNPALLAALTGIDVIADFRSRDVAEGGQGAPLVPVFHHALFKSERPRVVLNLGGIANVTILEHGAPARGFDTGPANVLLDNWIQDKQGLPYDESGKWAATGSIDPVLLDTLIAGEPWFALPPPKSTGRDLFNRAWLDQRLRGAGKPLADADVQATLQALTAKTVADAIRRHAPADIQDVLVCGGGACNTGLIREIQALVPCPVHPTSELGIPVQSMEALAFAWLAWAHDAGIHAGLPSVTGARRSSPLGCRYPA